MTHTLELINRLKRLRKITSNYAVAKELGISQSTLSNYESGASHADDRIAVMLADALKIDRFQTIAQINAERAKKPEERAFWKKIASAAVLILAVYTSMPTAQAAKVNILHLQDRVDIAHVTGLVGRGSKPRRNRDVSYLE
jgi:predicted transcriptional regulator